MSLSFTSCIKVYSILCFSSDSLCVLYYVFIWHLSIMSSDKNVLFFSCSFSLIYVIRDVFLIIIVCLSVPFGDCGPFSFINLSFTDSFCNLIFYFFYFFLCICCCIILVSHFSFMKLRDFCFIMA